MENCKKYTKRNRSRIVLIKIGRMKSLEGEENLKQIQAEKIKAQIDILKLIHLRLSIEGIDKADDTMVFTINELVQQLKELEDARR